jgi:class 3 adenylate cyclase
MTCATCNAPLADDARFCSKCGTPTATPASQREARKNVTMFFVDLVGSTELSGMFDPEALRAIMDRYFAAAASCITAHGGAVEKYIGDAVVATFGAAISHEDDALRAVRAALETLAKVTELNVGLMASHRVRLEVRCGICSGEVVAITDASGNVRVFGDPGNVASRLQGKADPGQILIDQVTASLVKTSVKLEPAGSLELKGKAHPVPAWRVTGLKVNTDLLAGPPAVRLIGREDDLDDLRSAYRRVTKRNQLSLVTVLGSPGIGKSRLVSEFVADLLPTGIIVLTGQCSTYGKGITFKPLAEMLNGFGGGWSALAATLEGSGAEARRATDCLSGLVLDNPDACAEPTGIEEIAWSVRYLLAQLGRTSPVVMIWENLQWAESTLLDVIDEVVNWLTDVPVMMICVSRPELLESRPGWGAGKSSTLTVEVDPLAPAQCSELLAELVSREEVTAHQQEAAICERVAAECDGNPLFAELLLDLLTEAAPGARVPPTISALLTARLDQLPADERRLLEIAAVIGRDFTVSALAAPLAAENFLPDRAQEILAQLVRKRILTRLPPGGFRFVQMQMCDNAYHLSPKSRRERLHLLLADRLARLISDHGLDSSGQDELALADHVEAARKLGRELLPGSTALPDLAPQAAAILIAEGMRALSRRDLPGAATLLHRGSDLIPDDDERQIALMIYISDCRASVHEPARAIEALRADHRDPRFEVVARIQRAYVELRIGAAGPDEIAEIAGRIQGELAGGGGAHDRAWCRLYQLQAYLDLRAERMAAAETKFRLALERARVMGDEYEEDRLLAGICEVVQWSPMDVDSGLRLCAETAHRFAANRAMLVLVLVTKARLTALNDDLDTARATLAEAATYSNDLHVDLYDAAMLGVTALVDSLAGDHRLAAVGYRRTWDLLIDLDQAPSALVYAAYAARELFEQGAVQRSELALRQLMDGPVELDPRTTVVTTSLQARLAASAGRLAEAVRLAQSAAELSEQADDLCLQGNSYLDLALVASQSAQPDLARRALGTAIGRYEIKGACGLIRRARNLLSDDEL